jgi:hypothetical protein
MRRTLAVALAPLLGAACAGTRTQHTTDVRPTTTVDQPSAITDAPPATTSAPPTEELVLRTVEGFVTSTVTVNDPPDPHHPDLARYRTGPVLENAVAAVRQNQTLGIAYRRPTAGPSRHHATIVGVDDGRATVRNCVVDDVQQIALSDGRVLNGSVATKLFETTVWRVAGEWKVVENVLVARWEGVDGCADFS